MTFKDVAIKNFKAHIRRYMSYFFCSSFSIMIFFMYSTILLNDKLNNSTLVAKEAMDVLTVPTVALIMFSVVFISYAHSSFIKSRQHEFGLFLSLGMSIKQIMKIIIFENGLVAIASMGVGIISGAVFSRLFFFIVLKVLKVSGIEFALPYKSLLWTLGSFSAIFLIAILASIIVAWRFQPVQLLKNNKVSQKNKISSPTLALVGISIMAGSIILLCIDFASPQGVDSRSLLMSTGICLAGLYLTISHLGGLLLKLAKKKKRIYYKNLRLFTALDYRFKQTKKIIFVTAIMVMATTFYCGAMAYFLSSADKVAVENNPFHVSFIQPSDKNIPEAELTKILTSDDTELKEHKILEVMNIKAFNRGSEESYIRKVISVDSINNITGSSLKVKQGYYIRLDQIPSKTEANENQFTKHDIGLKYGDSLVNFKFQEAVYKIYINRFQDFTVDILLLNNEDYEALKAVTDASSIENIHLLNYKDWRNTGDVVTKLNEREFFQIASRLGEYTTQKQGGSIILFISGFLGLFFFISGSVILSFRLFSEIDDEKAKYKQLSNIGIRDCEIKRTIYQELKVIFFIPVGLGALLSFLFIFAFTNDGGGQHGGPLLYNLLVSFIYFLFQIGYYFVVRRVYSGKVIESLRSFRC